MSPTDRSITKLTKIYKRRSIMHDYARLCTIIIIIISVSRNQILSSQITLQFIKWVKNIPYCSLTKPIKIVRCVHYICKT